MKEERNILKQSSTDTVESVLSEQDTLKRQLEASQKELSQVSQKAQDYLTNIVSKHVANILILYFLIFIG